MHPYCITLDARDRDKMLARETRNERRGQLEDIFGFEFCGRIIQLERLGHPGEGEQGCL